MKFGKKICKILVLIIKKRRKMKIHKYLIYLSILFTSCSTTNQVVTNIEKENSYNQNISPVQIEDIPKLTNVKNYINDFNTHNYWTEEVKTFYARRNFKPAWQQNGHLTPLALELTEAINEAEDEGLLKYDYNWNEIITSFNNLGILKRMEPFLMAQYAKLDILLTHTYLSYASDLLSGRLNPDKMEIIWEAHPRSKNLVEYLEEALERKQIQQSLLALNPDHQQYCLLRNELKRLIHLSPDKKSLYLDFNSSLRINDTSSSILTLRKFLEATGDLSAEKIISENDSVFNTDLENAVKKFQYRHELKPDGVIGKNTKKQMNKNLNYRIDQIKINMERLRWLPENFGNKYIIVNLPEYKLRYYENDILKEQMKVIIGKKENITPILIDSVDYIEFNPVWNVPNSIVSKEILPKLKQNPAYLKENNYQLIDGYSKNRKVVKPDSIEWEKITEDNFPYRIVQNPGRKNALGLVKFIFPNKHAIYLHDTPADYLFYKYERDLSHGCIRLERPIDLAKSILDQSEYVSLDSIENYLSQKKPKRIFLNEKVIVYFTYQTAWVDDNSLLHFSDDVYHLDNRQFKLTSLLHNYPAKLDENNIIDNLSINSLVNKVNIKNEIFNPAN